METPWWSYRPTLPGYARAVGYGSVLRRRQRWVMSPRSEARLLITSLVRLTVGKVTHPDSHRHQDIVVPSQ